MITKGRLQKKVNLEIGYEATEIGNAVTEIGKPLGIHDVIRHFERYEHDFDLQEKLGIKGLRYSIDWSKVFISRNKYDFSFYKPILESMRRRGFDLTIDGCHHKTAYQIRGEYTNPDFPELLTAYYLALKAEFPWIKKFVLINEPAVTAYLHTFLWGKYQWTPVFLNMAEGIVKASKALHEVDPEIEFHIPEPIDCDEVKNPQDKELVQRVNFLKEWGRFGMDDLLQGKIKDEQHGFFKHLVEEGADPERVLRFQENPAMPYWRDLDFYQHCFKIRDRDKNGKPIEYTNPKPPQLAEVIEQYRQRLPNTPIRIAETNIRGTYRDRITWARLMFHQCRLANIDSMTWWGITNGATWGDGEFTNKLIGPDDNDDCVGIFGLKDCPENGRLWTREANEFSEIIEAYVKNEIDIDDIPMYEPTGEYAKELMGYINSWMPGAKLLPAHTPKSFGAFN